ncbi:MULTISPECIES: ATP-binding cassette domain-containing protein [Aquificales]|uniref:ABC transporter ATP-binding protein n=1 Tax=Aquificales TaxID=32069 RepID=UPI00015F1F99|nr:MULTISPECIES: ATP-binding cassette domain-containing protein [Aquificales]EDP72971.1 molybdenum transport atp-binding protein [Hydrogenivirga sp. 128-5-R1-1]
MKIQIKKQLSGTEGEFLLDIDISIKEGSFITIFGKSGAGKTTILRAIAGLVDVEGFIQVKNTVWLDSSKGINLPPQKRKVGFVFQDYALFPNMTVEENIKFAMDREDKPFLEHLLEMTELSGIRNRKPDSLSGGQKQRVALARAVARKPDVLLLDEPLSALDIDMRRKLQEELIRFYKEFNLTTIMVSHDFSEIFRLSEKVFVLENGKIIKSGTPDEVFIQERISGKFRFSGEIIQIKQDETVYIVSVLVGNTVVRVIADPDEIKNLKTGDKVVVVSKAFNPFILKV